MDDRSDTVDGTGHVLRAGARPAIRLRSVTIACTRAEVTIAEGEVRWTGRVRVVATPDGAVVMLPSPVMGIAVGDRVQVVLTPTERRSGVPADIATVLGAHGLPVERWHDPEIRHLVRWVAEAKGTLRTERLDVVAQTLERFEVSMTTDG